MGHAYVERAAARPPRAADPDAGLRDRATPRSARTCARASASSCARSPSSPACAARRRWDFFATGCCSTSSPMLELDCDDAGRASDLPPPRARSPGRLAGARAGRGGVRAAGVRRARQRRTTSTTRRPRRSLARDAVERATGRVRGAAASSRWCGSARRSRRAQAQARIARVARGAARSAASAAVVAYRAAAATARLVSRDGRSTYLLATFSSDAGGRAADAIEDAARAASRGVDAGRRRGRRAAGRRPGVGGHRARGAARVPDPVPAVAARLPQRGRRRCCRWPSARRRSCSVPRDPARQHTSSRCRSSR